MHFHQSWLFRAASKLACMVSEMMMGRITLCVTKVHVWHAGQAKACAADVSFASHTPCHTSSTYKSHRIVAYVGLGLYLWFHTWYVRMGRRHHSVFPYSSFR